MASESKTCAKCDNSFPIEAQDYDFYKKIGVPTPTLCPTCRQVRRMAFHNFKTLYKSTSDLSGKPIISMYAPGKPYKVYTHEEWWSDDWDAKDYGREFDFEKTFFEQFEDLLLAVPRFNFMNTQSENCEYSNFVANSKNCYMVFGCVDTENSAYGHIVWESQDSLDNLYIHKSELCWECVDCLGSYNLAYCQECDSCTDSVGLFDCRSCTNCIGCVGLKQKSYCVFNEQLSKEAYEEFIKKHPLNDPQTIAMILEKQMQLRKSLPQRHFFGNRNENVSGNHIYNAKNVQDSFDIKGGENSRFIYTSRNIKDSYDAAFLVEMELCHETISALGGNQVMFAHTATNCSAASYVESCFNSHNIFGCVGLKSGEYCILNKQYTKEEYESLKTKIIEHMKDTGEWGEFFPSSISPFQYNESIAQEYFPLEKEEARKKDFGWQEDIPRTSGQENISLEDLPQDPDNYSEDLLKKILKCTSCGYNYRLVPQELSLCKRLELPLPKECFNCRHARRMLKRNTRDLWDANCVKCGNGIKTSYSPAQQKKFNIHCEKCYLSELG